MVSYIAHKSMKVDCLVNLSNSDVKIGVTDK